jgi:hypothetical protein
VAVSIVVSNPLDSRNGTNSRNLFYEGLSSPQASGSATRW